MEEVSQSRRSRQSQFELEAEEDAQRRGWLPRLTQRLGIEPKKFDWKLYRRLLDYSVRNWELLTLLVVLYISMAYVNALLPLQIGQIIDRIGSGLAYSVRDYFQLCFMLAVFTIIQKISLGMLEERVFVSLKENFFRRIMNADLAFLDRNKVGDLSSRLGSDIGQAKAAVSSSLCHLVRQSLNFTALLIALLTTNFLLALLVILNVTLLGLSTLLYTTISRVLAKKYRAALADTNCAVLDSFRNIPLVKSRCTERLQMLRLEKTFYNCMRIKKQRALLSAFFRSFSVLIPNLNILMVLLVGGYLVEMGSATSGELTSFILYSSEIAGSASGISSSITNVVNGTACVERVFDIWDQANLVTQPDDPVEGVTGYQLILDRVYFAYDENKDSVLEGLSLRVPESEYLAVVGASGSGKSTLLKLLIRGYDPDQGAISLGGTNIRDLKLRTLRQVVGIVTQEPLLFSGTVRENLVYNNHTVTEHELEETLVMSGCSAFINDRANFPLGLDTPLAERGSNLSGGQRQRLSVARALLRKPKVLLLDQATSALDSKTEKIVQQTIQLISRDRFWKPTIIVVAHRLSTIINANRIIVMDRGRVAQQGTHHQLLSNGGIYSQLVQAQLLH